MHPRLYPELVLKENDMGEWIVQSVLGDSIHERLFDNLADAKGMLDTLQAVWEDVYPSSLEPSPDPYLKGYSDGHRNVRHSWLWASSKEYQMGWSDGEGDRIYDVKTPGTASS